MEVEYDFSDEWWPMLSLKAYSPETWSGNDYIGDIPEELFARYESAVKELYAVTNAVKQAVAAQNGP